MRKRHERTLKLEEHFMSLRELGLSIAEIAERCEVSTWTVYQRLGDIAEANDVTRESLLYRPRKSCSVSDYEKSRPLERFFFDELLTEIEEMKKEVESILGVFVLE